MSTIFNYSYYLYRLVTRSSFKNFNIAKITILMICYILLTYLKQLGKALNILLSKFLLSGKIYYKTINQTNLKRLSHPDFLK